MVCGQRECLKLRNRSPPLPRRDGLQPPAAPHMRASVARPQSRLLGWSSSYRVRKGLKKKSMTMLVTGWNPPREITKWNKVSRLQPPVFN